MASFTAQAAIRSKWTSLVEEHTIEVPPEVTNKVTSVVGWLKQVQRPFRYSTTAPSRFRSHTFWLACARPRSP